MPSTHDQERLQNQTHTCVATPSPSRKPFEPPEEQTMVVRNPAPDASPSSSPSTSCTYTLSY
jgi:hypothetical protein